MGLETGKATYAIARIQGGAVPDHAALQSTLDASAFREIDARSDVQMTIGFCDFNDPDQPPTADRQFMAVRIDSLAVPGKLMKQHARTEERKRCAQLGRDKLSKKERDQLKLEVQKRLRLKVMPRTTHVQIVWDGDTARIFAGSRSLALTFELLEKAFELRLGVVDSVTLAREFIGDEALAKLEPSRFHLIRSEA